VTISVPRRIEQVKTYELWQHRYRLQIDDGDVTGTGYGGVETSGHIHADHAVSAGRGIGTPGPQDRPSWKLDSQVVCASLEPIEVIIESEDVSAV